MQIDYSKITSDNIAEYYNKYGADIFKDVDMLVPTYITNNGDIFGQNDTDQGIRYDNYKLIVIQRINLYEQIKHNYPNLITNIYYVLLQFLNKLLLQLHIRSSNFLFWLLKSLEFKRSEIKSKNQINQ